MVTQPLDIHSDSQVPEIDKDTTDLGTYYMFSTQADVANSTARKISIDQLSEAINLDLVYYGSGEPTLEPEHENLGFYINTDNNRLYYRTIGGWQAVDRGATTDNTLSSEQVQDIVGGMFTDNSVSGIIPVYNDSTGKIDMIIPPPPNEGTDLLVGTTGRLPGLATPNVLVDTGIDLPSSGDYLMVRVRRGNRAYSTWRMFDRATLGAASDTIGAQPSNNAGSVMRWQQPRGLDCRFTISTDNNNNILAARTGDFVGNDFNFQFRSVVLGGYSEQEVQNLVGAMFTGNTQQNITATFDATTNKINLQVAAPGGNTGTEVRLFSGDIDITVAGRLESTNAALPTDGAPERQYLLVSLGRRRSDEPINAEEHMINLQRVLDLPPREAGDELDSSTLTSLIALPDSSGLSGHNVDVYIGRNADNILLITSTHPQNDFLPLQIKLVSFTGSGEPPLSGTAGFSQQSGNPRLQEYIRGFVPPGTVQPIVTVQQATSNEHIEDVVGRMLTRGVQTGGTLTYNDDNGSLNLAVSGGTGGIPDAEAVQDIVGAMITDNTESGIDVTYDDNSGKLDFDVTGAAAGTMIPAYDSSTSIDLSSQRFVSLSPTWEIPATGLFYFIMPFTAMGVEDVAIKTIAAETLRGLDASTSQTNLSTPSVSTAIRFASTQSGLANLFMGRDSSNNLLVGTTSASLSTDAISSVKIYQIAGSGASATGIVRRGTAVYSASAVTMPAAGASWFATPWRIPSNGYYELDIHQSGDRTTGSIFSAADVRSIPAELPTSAPSTTGDLQLNENFYIGRDSSNSLLIGRTGTLGSSSGWTINIYPVEAPSGSGGGATLDTEQVQDIVGAMVTGGTETNIAVTYDDAAGKLNFVADDTNTQLTNEQVQDIVGAMVTDNTESNINVSYDDNANKINFSVPQPPPTLNTEAVQDIVGAMVDGNTETNMSVTYDDNAGKLNFSSTQLSMEQVQDIIGNMVSGNTETRISVTYNDVTGKLDFVADDQTTTQTVTTEQIQDVVGAMVSGNIETNISATYDDNAGKLNLVVSGEAIQDIVGGMVSGNTESGISVVYDDSNGKLNFNTSSSSSKTEVGFSSSESRNWSPLVGGTTFPNVPATNVGNDLLVISAFSAQNNREPTFNEVLEIPLSYLLQFNAATLNTAQTGHLVRSSRGRFSIGRGPTRNNELYIYIKWEISFHSDGFAFVWAFHERVA